MRPQPALGRSSTEKKKDKN